MRVLSELHQAFLSSPKNELAKWIDQNSDRYQHILGVVVLVEQITNHLPKETRELSILCAYLHDIGYSPSIKNQFQLEEPPVSFFQFHPIDGYHWILMNKLPEVCAYVAKYHTFSEQECKLGHKLLYLSYERGEKNEEHQWYIDLITYADLRTSPKGERVTPMERIEEIGQRRGFDSVPYRVLNRSQNEIEQNTQKVENGL